MGGLGGCGVEEEENKTIEVKQKHLYQEKKSPIFQLMFYGKIPQNNNKCRLQTGLNQIIFVCDCVCRINNLKGNSLNQFLVSMGTSFEMKKTTGTQNLLM